MITDKVYFNDEDAFIFFSAQNYNVQNDRQFKQLYRYKMAFRDEFPQTKKFVNYASSTGCRFFILICPKEAFTREYNERAALFEKMGFFRLELSSVELHGELERIVKLNSEKI